MCIGYRATLFTRAAEKQQGAVDEKQAMQKERSAAAVDACWLLSSNKSYNNRG